MVKSPTVRVTAPDTVWLARGHHVGSAAEASVRHRLPELKREEVIDDHLELAGLRDGAQGRAFEARWRVADDVVVRARLTIGPPNEKDAVRDWVLVAEAEQPWDLDWPSPATMFWPEDADASWDHDVVPGLRFRGINPLPTDDKHLKRLLKDCARRTWSIHVVVHEAMTPDEVGRRPLASLMPPSLRHRVVEHRAAPDQFQVVNWALDDLGVQVPRGGAVVLPGVPARPGYERQDFTVRSVFLDGSEPTELIDSVVRFAQLPRPLPARAEDAISELREEWHLMTVEEELAHARRLVATYAEALEAMTKSRDLYRDAAERAYEALAVYRENAPDAVVPAAREEPRKRERFSLRALTKPLERVGAGAKLLRVTGSDDSVHEKDPVDEEGTPDSERGTADPERGTSNSERTTPDSERGTPTTGA